MTAVAEIDIWNQSLRAVGNSTEVQSIDENTAEANACRRFYGQARDEVLEEFPWPFAKVTLALALVEINPTTEWAFAYRYPQDCLTLRRILGTNGYQPMTTEQRIPYLIGTDDEGQLIYTNRCDAVMEYTKQVTNTTTYAPSLVKAIALKLAEYIAPSVTGGDPYKLGLQAGAKYPQALAAAQANAVNEEQALPQPPSEFIQVRGGWGDCGYGDGPFPYFR